MPEQLSTVPAPEQDVTRRNFMKGTARTAAATAAGFQIVRPQALRGDSNEKLSIGIVGCGGRGTRGVAEAIRGNPNYELQVMGDLFEDQMERSLRRLRDSDEFEPEVKQQIKVAPENRYLGYDAYKKVVDSGVDVVFLHTPPGWRPQHLEYAINAGKNVFAEKPLATDMMGAQKVIRLAKESEQKKLTVMIGAQRRSQKEYVESVRRIQDGEIGDVVATYANWISGPVLKGADFQEKLDQNSLAWQQRGLVLACLDLWRPDRGTAPAQYRRHQLGDGRHTSGERRSLRRSDLAPTRKTVWKHLRSRPCRLRIRQRRAHVEPLPAVPGTQSAASQRTGDRYARALDCDRLGQ